MNVQFHFVIIQDLQAGGYGDVKLARRVDTNELVVVKYLREHQNLEARRIFEREIRILGRNLPGLIRLLGRNADPNTKPFYVMPYLPSGHMTRWAGRLSPDQLGHVARQLARALGRLHAANIAHGDVKPDNVLLGPDGECQVADPLGNGLGCTVLFSENRGGTPGYCAPEIVAGSQISNEGDVYSLGATIYHLATGVVPRDGEQLGELIARYDVPDVIKNAVAACCDAEPANRPSMIEVVRILQGESWGDIQTSKSEAKGWAVLGGIALALLLMAFAWPPRP